MGSAQIMIRDGFRAVLTHGFAAETRGRCKPDDTGRHGASLELHTLPGRNGFGRTS